MDDTFFAVPADKIDRLTDCYTFVPGKGRDHVRSRRGRARGAAMPKLVSGGGGLVSTALDYHRFCTMLLNGGELDGARIVGRKTIELMTHEPSARRRRPGEMSQSLFSEAANAGTGFGLGFAVTIDVAPIDDAGIGRRILLGRDVLDRLLRRSGRADHMVFMTQMSPSSTYPIRRELKTMIYSALT